MQDNQGMALLMALVMLAIASTLAVSIWYNSQLSVARINNLQQTYQAKHYSQGMLLWASDLLREDYAQDEYTHDSSLDAWQQVIQGMLVEDAILSGTLVGLSGRFNVNNVVINGVQNSDQLAYLRRLLMALELDVNIAAKIIDWIDTDQVPEPNGAEDFIYLAKSPAYQTSGGPFRHIEELALLDGMDAETHQILSQYLVALPPINDQPTRMNVNTMPPVMIKALSPLISNDMAVRLYQSGQADFLRLEDFFTHESIRYKLNDDVKQSIRPMLSVQTRHFQASALVQMEASSFVMYAMLNRRTDGSARVISRSLSPYMPNPLVN